MAFPHRNNPHYPSLFKELLTIFAPQKVDVNHISCLTKLLPLNTTPERRGRLKAISIQGPTLKQMEQTMIQGTRFDDQLKTIGEMPWQDASDYYFSRFEIPEEKIKRRNARKEILSKIETSPIPTQKIKVVISDIDECKSSHYSPTTWSGFWALFQIAKQHKLDLNRLCSASQLISDWYIGHHEVAYLNQLSQKTGLSQVLPEYNRSIVRDWHRMREEMYKKSLYRNTFETIDRIKEDGGLFFNASSGVLASAIMRLSMWGGAGFEQKIDGLAIMENLEGMTDHNPHQTENEASFRNNMFKDGKIYIGKKEEIKSHPAYLLWCFEKANEMARLHGQPPIKPSECLMVGDSLNSDMGAALRTAEVLGEPMQSACIVKGAMTDELLVTVHDLVGEAKSLPSADKLIRKIEGGDYNRPNIAIIHYSELLDYYKITPALKPSRDTALDRRVSRVSVRLDELRN